MYLDLQEKWRIVGGVIIGGDATNLAADSVQAGADHRFEQMSESEGSLLLQKVGVFSHSCADWQ